jgi:hypothetical protein
MVKVFNPLSSGPATCYGISEQLGIDPRVLQEITPTKVNTFTPRAKPFYSQSYV